MNREERIVEIAAELKAEHEAREASDSSRGRRPSIYAVTDADFIRWAKSRLHREEMAAAKDTSVIPVGYYCYGTSPCGTKGVCPYWSNPKTGDTKSAGSNPEFADRLNMDKTKWFAHCSFLERNSDYRDTSKGHGSSLIWDKVKECGQNPEPKETEDESAAFGELSKIVDGYMEENGLKHINIGMDDRGGACRLRVTRDWSKKHPQKNPSDEHADAIDALLDAKPELGKRMKASYGSVSFTKNLFDTEEALGEMDI